MTKVEYIKAVAPIMATMQRNGIDVKMLRFLPMYEDWARLREEGHKQTWVAMYLAEQYAIGLTKFYRIINKFKGECVI